MTNLSEEFYLDFNLCPVTTTDLALKKINFDCAEIFKISSFFTIALNNVFPWNFGRDLSYIPTPRA